MKFASSISEPIRCAAAELLNVGAREVYLFGSAARGEMHPGSDIDMAVSGLPPERFFRAMANAHGMLDCELDLVDLDEDTPFTEYLRKKGQLVRVA